MHVKYIRSAKNTNFLVQYWSQINNDI